MARPISFEARVTFFCRLKRLVWHVLIVAGGLGVTSCVNAPSPSTRLIDAQELAAQKGWGGRIISAGSFDLLAFHPTVVQTGERLTIYIEGDGFAWATNSRPSTDPTPINPVALRLALVHPDGTVAYLARPCQYTMSQGGGCPQRYWTNARFAPDVVDAMNGAISTLKDSFGAEELVLVGYSGGAAIATLVAVRRDDVAGLITVAGNLDHRAWTTHHRLAPLSGSLNPIDFADRIEAISQTHFIGQRDHVIPPSLALQWPEAFSGLGGENVRILQSFDHACCWERDWVMLVPKS